MNYGEKNSFLPLPYPKISKKSLKDLNDNNYTPRKISFGKIGKYVLEYLLPEDLFWKNPTDAKINIHLKIKPTKKMKKILIASTILAFLPFVSGCQEKKSEVETINPFSIDSMNNTYQDSKDKIDDTVKKENEKINQALEDSGLAE